MKEIFEYDVSNINADFSTSSLYEGRKVVSNVVHESMRMNSDVTILIQGYNRLDKTKQCLESVLKYTKNINYDLILVDNGSSDETFEYFKSINYDKVRIIRLNKNIMTSLSLMFININWISKYFVPLANDIIVTENWLSNMIKIAESDKRIGMVNPVSSNVSNLQEVDIEYNNYDEMHRKVHEYNKSNPVLWHERLRLVTLGVLFTRECLYAIGFPHCDVGFLHDFGDDDITFRVRRAGYKAILAKDTWIHHNHDIRNMENKDPVEFQKSLEVGRVNFKEKYYGIDAWDDVNNYIPDIIPSIKNTVNKNDCSILGIDVKCGTPILEIKNHLRSYEIFEAECCAATSEGKYFIDLQTVCGKDNVVSCTPDKISDYFDSESFDYIILGNSINEYPEPFNILRKIYSLLKKGGQMFIYLKNNFDIYSLLNIIGYRQVSQQSLSYNITLESFITMANQFNIPVELISIEQYLSVPQEYIDEVNNKIGLFAENNLDETLRRLLVDKFVFSIIKQEI